MGVGRIGKGVKVKDVGDELRDEELEIEGKDDEVGEGGVIDIVGVVCKLVCKLLLSGEKDDSEVGEGGGESAVNDRAKQSTREFSGRNFKKVRNSLKTTP
jgi:hypothetical protein